MSEFNSLSEGYFSVKYPSLATYSFNGMDLRVAEIDGEPWFVAKDALLAMGYPHHSHAKIREKLGGDEKAKKRVPTPSGAQQAVLVSESGLYKLTMRSDKKEAKQFQDWVTREVQHGQINI